MLFGISFAVARYNALDWIRAFKINSLPFDDRLVFDHFFSILDCLLRIVSHCMLVFVRATGHKTPGESSVILQSVVMIQLTSRRILRD